MTVSGSLTIEWQAVDPDRTRKEEAAKLDELERKAKVQNNFIQKTKLVLTLLNAEFVSQDTNEVWDKAVNEPFVVFRYQKTKYTSKAA